MEAWQLLSFSDHQLQGRSLSPVYSPFLAVGRSQSTMNRIKELPRILLRHYQGPAPYCWSLISQPSHSTERDPTAYLLRIPAVDKEIIRPKFNNPILVGLSKRSSKYCRSGVSTVEPPKFVQDQYSCEQILALQPPWSKWALPGVCDFLVRTWGSPAETMQHSSARARAHHYLSNACYGGCFQKTPEKTRNSIEFPNNTRPKSVVALASAAHDPARFATKDGIEARSQRAVGCSFNASYPSARQKTEEVLRWKAQNRYGSAGTGDIDCECFSEEGLHMDPRCDYVKGSDDAGHPVPQGIHGHIVVASLVNFAMPVVRSDIGDPGASPESDYWSRGRLGPPPIEGWAIREGRCLRSRHLNMGLGLGVETAPEGLRRLGLLHGGVGYGRFSAGRSRPTRHHGEGVCRLGLLCDYRLRAGHPADGF
jgi:phenylacetate-CoA ligase